MTNPKSKILVSACLYGFCCRYDGKSNLLKDKMFMALKNSGRLIPVCAEELGGLSTPRIPSEIKDGKVISKEGKDVTAEFEKGAERALEIAKKNGTTRATACMDKAASLNKPLIFAIGNAPTALVRLYELIQDGKLRPELIIGVPVGFVNVVQSKELIMQTDVPYIIARGRKGGSNVAAAICNAILYDLDKTRGLS